jgi:hypothetical protein
MHTTDPSPKSKRKPNKAKVDPDRPWTPLDAQLESELKAFHVKLHTEWWKDAEDCFLGPTIFLSRHQIQHLCHLSHANALATIEDLQNNFKWNWMEDYSMALLHLIHSVYKLDSTSDSMQDPGTINPGTSAGNSAFPSSSTNPPNITPCTPAKPVKPRTKRGPGHQRCGACQLLGHNSESLFLSHAAGI